MGSIQALRSEALAARSRDDTELQVSSYLGGVNKSLGGQILNMIDQLQGVVVERTKAYNKANAGLKQKVEKKGGLGDNMVQFGFQAVDSYMKNLAKIYVIAQVAIKIATGGSVNANTIIGMVADAVSVISGILGNNAMIDSIHSNVKSAVYDYEKMISQLGMMDKVPPDKAGNPGTASAGAGRILDKRDALMPRYKPNDTTFLPASLSTGGYVGSIRRV